MDEPSTSIPRTAARRSRFSLFTLEMTQALAFAVKRIRWWAVLATRP